MKAKDSIYVVIWILLLSGYLGRKFPALENKFLLQYGPHIFVGTIVLVFLRYLVLWILFKKKRSYIGYFGGAVCPKCRKPFAIHWWGIKLGSKKYDRCPHCHQWSRVAPADESALQKAAVACGLEPYIEDAFDIAGKKSIISE